MIGLRCTRKVTLCFARVLFVTFFSVWLLVLSTYLPKVDGDLFTSLSSLETLVQTEAYVVKSIKSYLPDVSGSNKKWRINKYLANCDKENKIAMQNVVHYLGNPINAYKLIKRLTLDLEYIEDMLIENTYYSRNKTFTYPTFKDLDGAMKGLIHLTTIYNLNVTDLADGALISNISKDKQPFAEFVLPMTASDCYELGLAAHEYREYTLSIAWMSEALRKYKDCDNCVFTELQVIKFISQVYYKMGAMKNFLHWREKCLTFKLKDEQRQENINLLKYFQNMLEKQERKLKNFTETSLIRKSEEKTADDFCLGEKTLNQNSLHCYYKSGPKPFVKLARFRVEQLHLDPNVTMYHDVLTDEEIEELKQLARPKLKTPYKNDVNLKNAQQRVVKLAWIWDENSKTAEKISIRISDFTDHAVNKTQRLEVGNYGIGGFHGPHYDIRQNIAFPHLKKNETISVDVTKLQQMTGKSTTILYMSDVEQGGATIFLQLGLTVFPKKNAAVTWSSYNATGHLDTRMYHAGCPVLRGSKWVATKLTN